MRNCILAFCALPLVVGGCTFQTTYVNEPGGDEGTVHDACTGLSCGGWDTARYDPGPSQVCGDGQCSGTENCSSCAADCKLCDGQPCDSDDQCSNQVCMRVATGTGSGRCTGTCAIDADCASDCCHATPSGARGCAETSWCGTLSAAALDATSTRTGTTGSTVTFDVAMDVVVFDKTGKDIESLDGSTAFSFKDWTNDDQVEFKWSPPIRCTREKVTGSGGSVSAALLMDQSGSMTSTDPQDLRISASKEFLESMAVPDEVLLISFADQNSCSQYPVSRWGDFTTSYNSLFGTIDAFAGCEGGGTPLFDAMAAGVDNVVTEGTNPSRALVVLTDGEDTSSAHASEASVTAAATQEKVPIFTVGLSTSINVKVLADLAYATDGAFFFAADIGNMVSAFRAMNHLVEGTYTIQKCTTTLDVAFPGAVNYLRTTLYSSVQVSYDGKYASAPLRVELLYK